MKRTTASLRTPLARLAALAGAAAVLTLATACGGDGHPAATAPPMSAATFNDADIEFAQNMIPHHQQAVQMAELAAERATDPEVRQLAAQIKAAQEPEINAMTGWLDAWDRPVQPPQGHGGHAMPGMMADAELAELMAAHGADFDRMFAQMMIAHHNGAIEMARDLRAQGASAEAKALAATIESAQAAEIARLDAIIDRL